MPEPINFNDRAQKMLATGLPDWEFWYVWPVIGITSWHCRKGDIKLTSDSPEGLIRAIRNHYGGNIKNDILRDLRVPAYLEKDKRKKQ